MLLGALNTGSDPAETTTTGFAEFAPGSVLVLYSDGLVERDSVTVEEATEALYRTMSAFEADRPLEQLCRRLLLETTGARDDTTVFAVRIAAD